MRAAGCCRPRSRCASSAPPRCFTCWPGSRWRPAPAQWLGFGGGLGWPLAALHLVTLGVLGMTALGAGAQLLPVATRQPAPGPRWLAAIWWLYTPGVALLALGMGWPQPQWLAAGAVAVALAFDGLGRADAAPPERRARHAGRGVAWLGGAGRAGGAAGQRAVAGRTWLGLPVPSRDITLGLHLVFAPYGFMGVLALGLSYILVPMFALAECAGRTLAAHFLRAGRGGAAAGRDRRLRLGAGAAAHRRLAGRRAGRWGCI